MSHDQKCFPGYGFESFLVAVMHQRSRRVQNGSAGTAQPKLGYTQ